MWFIKLYLVSGAVLSQSVHRTTQSFVPEYFDVTNSKFTEIFRQYSYYQNRKGFITKSVLNLLGHISMYKDCLVHIINYDGLDIKFDDFPVAISRYDLVHVGYAVKNDILSLKYRKAYSFRHRYYHFENVPSKNETIAWCKQSITEWECQDFPTIQMTGKIKPWRCEANFYLFPPLDPAFLLYDSRVRRKIFMIPSSYTKNFWNFLGNLYQPIGQYMSDTVLESRERYDVLITSKDTEIKQAWKNSLATFREGFMDTSTYTNRELVIVTANVISYSKYFQQINLKLSSVSIMCKHCSRSKLYAEVNIEFVNNFETLKNIVKLLNFNPDNMIYQLWMQGVTKEQTTAFVEENGQDDSLMKIDPMKYRWNLHASQLKSIFGNASLNPGLCDSNTRKDLPCDDLLNAVVRIAPSGSMELAHYQFYHESLTFVGCGKSMLASLEFGKLTATFDGPSWFLIIASIFLLATITSLVRYYNIEYLRKIIIVKSKEVSTTKSVQARPSNVWVYINEYLIDSFLIFMGSYLDQIDPAPSKFTKYSSLQILLAPFLLVLTVIQTLYSDGSVTDLVFPRATIPINNFETLVSLNYQIYTKEIDNFWFSAQPEFAFLNSTLIQFQFRNLENSELFRFVQSDTCYKIFNPTLIGFTSKANYYLNHTKRLPQKIQICKKKIAILLPEIEAVKKFTKMHKDGLPAFIGEDLNFNTKFGVTFIRHVSPIILQRFAGLVQSGMRGMVDDYISWYLQKLKGAGSSWQIVQSANLQGNFIVIFVPLLAGLSTGFIIFIVENFKNVVGRIRYWYEKSFGVLMNKLKKLDTRSIEQII